MLSKIKRTLQLLIYFLTKPVSYFLKPKKHRWIIGGNRSKELEGNAFYFLQYIRKDHPEIEIIFISREVIPIRIVRKSGGKAYYNFSMRGLYYIFTAEVYFWSISPADITFVDSEKTVVVNLSHGMPMKKIIYDALNSELVPHNSLNSTFRRLTSVPYEDCDLCVATSEFYVPILQSAFKSEKVLPLGLPRNDYLMEQHDKNYIFSLKKKIRCEGKKIIAYLPTHRNFGEYTPPLLFEEKEEVVKSKLGNEYVVLTKHHFWSNYENTTQLGDTVFCLDDAYLTTQELLLITDILITDYSSVFIDYLLLERPVLFYCYDLDRINLSDFYYFDQEILPGPISTDEVTLLKDLIRIRENPKETQKKLKKNKNHFHHYSDNMSSERIYKEVYKILNEENII